jgi:DNA-binding NtrC family response regulator
VFPVEIPPLRRRRGDVLLLAEAFVSRYATELGRRGLRLSEEARRTLLAHSWPGNVRELQNCIERAAILCDGSEIRPPHLRLDRREDTGPALDEVLDLSGPLKEVLERSAARVEEETIRLALKESGGDRDAAAARLGISVSTLGRRLRALPPEP